MAMKTFGKAVATAALVGLLTVMPGKKLMSQSMDTTKVKLNEGKEIVLKKPVVKPHLSLKSILRNYNGDVGAGVGFDAGLDIGKVSIGTSLTGIKTQDGMKIEEAGVNAFIPLGNGFALIPGIYTDEYLGSAQGDWVKMVILKYKDAKLGAEVGKDFSDVFVKYSGIKGFTPFVDVVMWNGSKPFGPIQKLVVGATMTVTDGKYSFTIDLKGGSLWTSTNTPWKAR